MVFVEPMRGLTCFLLNAGMQIQTSKIWKKLQLTTVYSQELG